jgi:hypothetical protein
MRTESSLFCYTSSGIILLFNKIVILEHPLSKIAFRPIKWLFYCCLPIRMSNE